MIRASRCRLLGCAAMVLWEECGENLAIFCYRIGWEVISNVRARTLFLIPVSVRTEAACWKPLFTSFAPSTIPKDSDS